MLLTQKYSPKKLDEVLGSPENIEFIRQWILQWKNGKQRRPLLIYGPSGVGKTCVAAALANEYDLQLLELNASELRNREKVERITGPASLGGTLFGNMRLVLIDDVDIFAGRSDSGGSSAISAFLKECPCPILLTATDIWDKKLSGIRTDCETIEFKRISKPTIRRILGDIAKSEQIAVPPELINQISENSNGDVRSAINDLSAGKTTSRDRDKDLFDLVRRIFKSEKYSDIKEALKGDFDYEILKLWIDENIAAEYEKPLEIATAYDYLSLADRFDGRIRKSYWQYLKYSIDLSTAGVCLSKAVPYRKFTKYNFPVYLKNMSRTVSLRATRKGIGQKIGKKVHASWRASLLYLPLLCELAKKDSDKLALYFEFDDEQLAFLLNTSVSKVRKKE
ncbi:replication factor C large subunit [Candidatus Micrarchaeota archaeon]|nr:replication factor C large subunit [Candidatus Micrarchaeota archaeon]